ncbi:MAG TPA: hypothetical protein VMV29_09250 [Ktedonobacterales bacterium]|nr:hypothetical protein [Ktedonobacterales bacterium]
MGETARPRQAPTGANPTTPIKTTAVSNVARRRHGSAHWRRDVLAPFALGLVSVGGWAGALALALVAPTSWVVWLLVRVAQGVLVGLPLLIVIIGVPRAHAYWRETDPGLWGAPVRLVTAMALIGLGLAPAFLAVAPQPAVASGNQVFSLLFAAPGFSLGLALGFTWGAHIRPVFSGVAVGWLGGLGFAAPLAALGVIGVVMAQQQANQCHTAGYGCMIGAELAQAANMVLIISPLIIGLVGIVGAAFGAFLSGE